MNPIRATLQTLASVAAPDDMAEDPKFLAAFAAYVAAAGYSFADFPGGLLAAITRTVLGAAAGNLGLPRGLLDDPRAEAACLVVICFVLAMISARVFLVPIWGSVAAWRARRVRHRALREGNRPLDDRR